MLIKKSFGLLILLIIVFAISGFTLHSYNGAYCPAPTYTPVSPTATEVPTEIPTSTPSATATEPLPTVTAIVLSSATPTDTSGGICTGVLGAALIPVEGNAYPSGTPFFVYVMTESDFVQVLTHHSAAGIVPIGSPYYTGVVDPITVGKIDVIECSRPRAQNYLIEIYWFDTVYMVYMQIADQLVPSVMYGMFSRTEPLAGILWYDSTRWVVPYNPNP